MLSRPGSASATSVATRFGDINGQMNTTTSNLSQLEYDPSIEPVTTR